jgi:hypothetical protein
VVLPTRPLEPSREYAIMLPTEGSQKVHIPDLRVMRVLPTRPVEPSREYAIMLPTEGVREYTYLI